MSTKRLSRTVIEGGRTHFSSYIRGYQTGAERARWRAREAVLRVDPDDDDARIIAPRLRVRRDFFDKLGPMLRWLRSHVGCPWREVHSLVFQTFDTRTLAGRHIVFSHLLAEVAISVADRNTKFFVDERGILREHPPRKWRKRWPDPVPGWAAAWIGYRKIGERGAHAYWFVPAWGRESMGAHRQDRRLDASELAMWRSLTPEHRALWRMALPQP